MAAFHYPSVEDVVYWGADESSAVAVQREVQKNERILTLSAVLPGLALLVLLIALLFAGQALDDGQYWSAVAALAVLIAAMAAGWRSIVRKRFPRVGLDYYCAVSIYYLRDWRPGSQSYRRYAQGVLSVVDVLLVDLRHAAMYAATWNSREALTAIHHAAADRLASKEQDWLRSDTSDTCKALIDEIGAIVTHRDFRQWDEFGRKLKLDASVVATTATTPPAAPLGRARDKVVDKLTDAAAVAIATLLLAVLTRLGLHSAPS